MSQFVTYFKEVLFSVKKAGMSLIYLQMSSNQMIENSSLVYLERLVVKYWDVLNIGVKNACICYQTL